jgi:hypothetical protein
LNKRWSHARQVVLALVRVLGVVSGLIKAMRENDGGHEHRFAEHEHEETKASQVR